jgi:hypothetical protein
VGDCNGKEGGREKRVENREQRAENREQRAVTAVMSE